MSLKKTVDNYKLIRSNLLKATEYTEEYIQAGPHCDSSNLRQLTMEFVKEAEKQFLKANKKTILTKAAMLVEQELQEIGIEP